MVSTYSHFQSLPLGISARIAEFTAASYTDELFSNERENYELKRRQMIKLVTICRSWRVAGETAYWRVVWLDVFDLDFLAQLPRDDRRLSYIQEHKFSHESRDYFIAPIDVRNLFIIFSALPALVKLKLEVAFNAWALIKPILDPADVKGRDESGISEISLLNLTNLRLDGIYDEDLSVFCGTLIRPKVQRSILGYSFDSIQPIFYLFPFLEELQVDNYRNKPDIISLLPPRIKKFGTIDSTKSTASEFRLLRAKPFYLTELAIFCLDGTDYLFIPEIPTTLELLILVQADFEELGNALEAMEIGTPLLQKMKLIEWDHNEYGGSKYSPDHLKKIVKECQRLGVEVELDTSGNAGPTMWYERSE